MAFPENEAETIALYELIQNRIGWRIVEYHNHTFPDTVLESGGDKLTCEFEFRSKSFQKHGHDPNGCDLIICWEDNWPESPVPVMTLRDCADEEAIIVNRLLKKSIKSSPIPQVKILNRKDDYQMSEDLVSQNLILRPGEWSEEDFILYLGGECYEELMFDIALRELEKKYGLEIGTFTRQGAGWLKPKRERSGIPWWVSLSIFIIVATYLLLNLFGVISLV